MSAFGIAAANTVFLRRVKFAAEETLHDGQIAEFNDGLAIIVGEPQRNRGAWVRTCQYTALYLSGEEYNRDRATAESILLRGRHLYAAHPDSEIIVPVGY